MADFPLMALAAGLGVAAMAGPLGCFVVWRRMAYFGDALAHSALLGIAIGLLFGVSLTLGVFTVCVLVALAIAFAQRRRGLATDTMLGILAHGTLALGLVMLALTGVGEADLEGYLFGDMLATGGGDAARILAAAAAALAILAVIWRPLLAITVHENLARAEGVAVERTLVVFMVLMALVIALAMKIVGILLITSLLIIPAATARRLAGSPEHMALMAAALGGVAVAAGLWASIEWQVPAGPSIVLAAAALFVVGLILPARR